MHIEPWKIEAKENNSFQGNRLCFKYENIILFNVVDIINLVL